MKTTFFLIFLSLALASMHAQLAGIISPSAIAVDSGYGITLNASASGGSGLYGYQWYASGSCNTNLINDALSSTYATYPASTTTYSYLLTDEVSNETICSNQAIVTVNPTLQLIGFTVSNASIYTNQDQILYATITGGSPSYFFNFTIYNPSGMIVYNYSILTQSTSEDSSFILGSGSNWQSGTYQATIKVKDSALQNESIEDNIQFTVNNTLNAQTIKASNYSIVIGEPSLITAMPKGGSPPYTINFFNQTNCQGNITATGISMLVYPNVSTSYSYNVIDSAGNTACSPAVNITITSPLQGIEYYFYLESSLNPPIITQSGNGYQVSNIGQGQTFKVDNLNITENFITPTYAGITINGYSIYQLNLSQPISIPGTNMQVVLTAINYSLALSMINLSISNAQPATTTSISTTSTSSISTISTTSTTSISTLSTSTTTILPFGGIQIGVTNANKSTIGNQINKPSLWNSKWFFPIIGIIIIIFLAILWYIGAFPF